MPYQDLEPVSKQLTIVVGLTVVGFMAFGLALSFYRNVLFEGTLKHIGTQNQRLREEISQGYRDLDYFRSAQFKDKYAKEHLNRLNPGEKVLIIIAQPASPATAESRGQSPTQAEQAAYEEYLRQIPVFDHWMLYLFHREKIEELRRGL